jgi:hypothetical protein
MRIDISKLPVQAIMDIEAFCENNNREHPRTTQETLEFFLNWNGIYGYTERILELVECINRQEGKIDVIGYIDESKTRVKLRIDGNNPGTAEHRIAKAEESVLNSIVEYIEFMKSH